MQKSKVEDRDEIIKKFVIENKDDLSQATFGKFHQKYPEVKISDAAYYVVRRKALGLPSYGSNKKKKNQSAAETSVFRPRAQREKMYKQFFTVAKKETTKEALSLLSRFIDKMNSSNYNTKFEIIEFVPRTADGDSEPIIEVREFK